MNDARARLIKRLGAAAVAVVVPLVAYHEGTVKRTYRDPIGIITACTGHVDSTLRMGTTYTDEQCKEMLYTDLLKHADDLDCIAVALTDNQKAALLSFTFNVGKKAFCGSTLVSLANAGRLASEWCKQLLRWTMAGGRELPGLVKRREAEYGLCVS